MELFCFASVLMFLLLCCCVEVATNSGRPFHVEQSSKRAHCLGVMNPARKFYLAAENETQYLGWVNAIHQNLKRLSERQKRRTRGSITQP
jgi:hypothetical protein